MKKWVKFLGLSLATGLLLTACGKKDSGQSVDTSDDGKEMTVTVYDDLANYQGIQSGWFGKLVKDKFNMKLKIIAPNVAGGGQTLFDSRSAAGNLGDIIITGAGSGRAKRLAKSNLISNMAPYAKGCKYLKEYKNATDHLNKLAGKDSGIWGIPGSVSKQSPTASSESIDPTFGPYLRWEYYKQLGYPKIDTLEDLLPVLKKMQAEARKENPGKKIYAISLFKDWDGNMMNNAKQPTCYYGYDEMGFALAKADGSDYQSITKTNGQYERVLRFFNKAYRMGLVDPESSTQNYDKLYAKYTNGQVLFSFWPWLGSNAYNTTKNKNAGKGFEMVDIKDMKIFDYGATPNGGGGSTGTIYLGSKAKNKRRIVKFINWLYSPQGVTCGGSDTAGAPGPKGMTWTIKNGQPVLTKFGEKALLEGGAKVPSKWGKGQFKDGISALNFTTVLLSDKNPETGYDYDYKAWPSVLKLTRDNPLDKDWSKHMKNSKTTLDYLKKSNKLLVAPGSPYVQPDESSEISTLRGQVKSKIVNDSWKAVFAKNNSQFDRIFSDMQKETKGLGIDKVLKFDMKCAHEQDKARKNIVKQYDK